MKMKKRLLTAGLAATLLLTGCATGQNTDSGISLSDNQTTQNISSNSSTPSVVLDASDAVLSGVTLKDTSQERKIEYDDADHCIIGIGEFSTAVYTVPDSADQASYDVYLNVSRASSAFVAGSTPVYVTINGETSVPSIPVTPCEIDQMGMNGQPTYQDDMGLFQIEQDITLAPGDTITLGGVAGSEFYYNGSFSSSLPALGDICLYPSGSEVTEGYTDNPFIQKQESSDPSDPLSGLNIAWLGSSVTYGQGADGYSMADEISETHKDTHCFKYAVSGTTLADYAGSNKLPTDQDGSHGSYVERLKQLDRNADYDLFIVQLSTNDATGGIPMGHISDSKDINAMDTSTVIGSMEYIIGYIQQTWHCPVMYYTGTKYDSEQYEEMVNQLLKLKDKWEIGVIDLWNDSDMNAVSPEDYQTYMKEDGIHPLRKGYTEWWTPKFEAAITDYLNEQ